MNCLLINILLLAMVLLILSACGDNTAASHSDEAALARVVTEGLLIPLEGAAVETRVTVAPVQRRTLVSTMTYILTPVFAAHYFLYFETPNRVLAAVHTERGERVQAGDVLAELEPLDPEEAERLFLQRQSVQLELSRFNRDFIEERDRRLNEINHAEFQLETANNTNHQRRYLELSRHRIQYQQFLHNSEQNRERITRRLEDINDHISGDKIIAPIDGIVLFSVGITPGTLLMGSPRMFILADENSFQLMHFFDSLVRQSPLRDGRNAFRYGDVLPAHILLSTQERFDFEVRITSDPWTTGERANMRFVFEPLDWDVFLTFFEENEINLAMPGVPQIFVNTTSYAVDVLTIPFLAVRQEHVNEYVYVYEAGERRRQFITTGEQCGQTRNYIEVHTGLHEGQQVYLHSR